MRNNRYSINPTVLNNMAESQKTNYGHVVSDMFNNLGNVKQEAEEKKIKKNKDELYRVNANQIKKNIEEKNYDKKHLTAFIQSPYSDLETYQKDNNITFKTVDAIALAKNESNLKMKKVYDESLADHVNYLKEKNLFHDENKNIDMVAIRKQLSLDPNNIHLAQAFERAYGINLNKAQIQQKKIVKSPFKTVKDGQEVYLQQTFDNNGNLLKESFYPVKLRGTKQNNQFMNTLKILKSKNKITEEESDDLLLRYATAKTQPSRTALAKDIETAETTERNFLKYLNIEGLDEYNLSTFDVRKFTPEQKGRAERVSNIFMRAYKPAGKERIAKEMGDIQVIQSQLHDSATYVLKELSSGKDFNMLDKIKREYVTKYFGMNDEDVAVAFKDSRFQSAMNMQLKILSGTAVSGTEWERFKQSVGTLFQTNKSVKNGMLSMIRDQTAKMESIKNTMGSTSFNLKYGGVHRNMKDLEMSLSGKADKEKNEEKVEIIIDKTKKENKNKSWRDYAN